MAVLGQPAMLDVVWNIAPKQVTTHAVPGGTFGPKHSRVKTLDGGIAEFVFGKARIQNNYVAIRITNRRRALTVIAPLAQRGRGHRRSHRSPDKTTTAY